MQIVVGGIFGVLIVLAFLMWYPVLLDSKYEIVEKEIMHPCQKLVLEILEADLEWRYYSKVFSNTNLLPQSTLVSEPLERLVVLQEKILDSGCYDKNNRSPVGDWFTVEFQEKIMIINHEGFHP